MLRLTEQAWFLSGFAPANGQTVLLLQLRFFQAAVQGCLSQPDPWKGKFFFCLFCTWRACGSWGPGRGKRELLPAGFLQTIQEMRCDLPTLPRAHNSYPCAHWVQSARSLLLPRRLHSLPCCSSLRGLALPFSLPLQVKAAFTFPGYPGLLLLPLGGACVWHEEVLALPESGRGTELLCSRE